MKKILSIYLALSMFFNLSFIFSEARASVIPVPLSKIGYENYPLYDYGPPIVINLSLKPYDLTRVLHRITALENLETAAILGQAQAPGIITDLRDVPIRISDNYKSHVSKAKNVISYFYYQKQYLGDIGVENRNLILDRISEIKSSISVVDQRLSDLKSALKSCITGIQGLPVSGVDDNPATCEAYFLKDAIGDGETYKKVLEKYLNVWVGLLPENRPVKITSIVPMRGKAGDRITINGEGFKNALVVGIYDQKYALGAMGLAKIVLSPSNIISNNRIDFTLPSIPEIMGDITSAILVTDVDANVGLQTNFTYSAGSFSCPVAPTCLPPSGCTYTSPVKDVNGCLVGCGALSCQDQACKCQSSTSYISLNGVKQCLKINSSSIDCSKFSYSPVCGCDGVTYNNLCFALLGGVKSYTAGQCGRPRAAFRSSHLEDLQQIQEDLFTINDPNFVGGE